MRQQQYYFFNKCVPAVVGISTFVLSLQVLECRKLDGLDLDLFYLSCH
jgi:hypothetical protein